MFVVGMLHCSCREPRFIEPELRLGGGVMVGWP